MLKKYTAGDKTPSEYDPIPKTSLFLHPIEGEGIAEEVFYWQWSPTFKKWGAYVLFSDGSKYFTWPIKAKDYFAKERK